MLDLYQKAFLTFQMGYGSALAWILAVIILLCTALVLKSSALWVYYEAETPKR
jgi:multiple sugar transport system permease protein